MPDEDQGSQPAAEPPADERPAPARESAEVHLSRSKGIDVIDASTPVGDDVFRPNLDAPGKPVNTAVQAVEASAEPAPGDGGTGSTED